jgi:hypothetical protein
MSDPRRRTHGTGRARRTLLTVWMAVATTIALAACGGVPTSGSVSAGDVVNDDVELDIGFAPQGPRADSTQEEIMQEFLLAAIDPQNDYRVAREFLAESFSGAWNPDALTTIRTGVGTQRRVSDTELNYSLTTSASVSSDGHYQESDAETVSLPFTFVKERGQWRISSAPEGIVLSEDSFGVVFGEFSLYYFDPSYQYLVPDVRWFPNRSGTSVRVVAALLAGQSSWLSNGVLISAFPAGTQLGDGFVEITSGVATVDLSEEAGGANSLERERMRQQLSASLSNVTSVVMTVGGIPLSTPETGAIPAVINPTVEPAPLVLRENQFGYASNDDVTSIGQISDKVVELGATAVALARNRSEASVRNGVGVYAVRSGGTDPLLVDARAGLAAPSIDNAGFVWSVPVGDGSAIRAYELDGTEHIVSSAVPVSDARVVSMAVSRDGARLMLYLDTAIGPRLYVAGIVRQDGVPSSLGELFALPVTAETPLGATWVDNRTVATLSRSEDETLIRSFEIGGPSSLLGRIEGGQSIVGGNGGTDGLRVLTVDGDVFRPRGTSWQRTGISAEMLGTQQ